MDCLEAITPPFFRMMPFMERVWQDLYKKGVSWSLKACLGLAGAEALEVLSRRLLGQQLLLQLVDARALSRMVRRRTRRSVLGSA